jgi:hypothetical protein
MAMEAIPLAGSRAWVAHGSATPIDIFQRSPARGEPPVAGLDWIDAFRRVELSTERLEAD